jgi:hypothetical protein
MGATNATFAFPFLGFTCGQARCKSYVLAGEGIIQGEAIILPTDTLKSIKKVGNVLL